MKQVVLVGTWHDFQHPGQSGAPEFRVYLDHACIHYAIQALAEEMSTDALKEKSSPFSVPFEVAEARAIPHKYCDPDKENRRALGIRQENDLKVSAWMEKWSKERFDRELRNPHALRERLWLDHLKALNIWPALFVCGADHISPFTKLLQAHDITVIVAEALWKPQQPGFENYQ